MSNTDAQTVAKAFLLRPENTVTRERMYFNRLFFELKMAGARRGYALTIFESEVDRDGYDMILDDADLEKRFQLKVVGDGATTSKWKVHKRLLRPSYSDGETARWPPSRRGIGGGLLIMQASIVDTIRPLYYLYTDWHIIEAIAQGLIRLPARAGETLRNKADAFLGALYEGVGNERIAVPKSLLLNPKDADNLLALAGFHNATDVYYPFGNFMRLFMDNARISRDFLSISSDDINLAAALEHAAVEIIKTLTPRGYIGFEIPEKLKRGASKSEESL